MKRLNLLFFLVGVAFLAVTLWGVGLDALVQGAFRLGGWFWPMVAMNLLWYAADARGWASVLGPQGRFPGRLRRLVLAQVAGEAINNATPLLNLGGEPMKALLVHGRVPGDALVSSLVVDNTIKYIATVGFIAAGLGLSLAVLDLSWQVQTGLVAAFATIAILVGLAVAAQASGLLGRSLALARRLGMRQATLDRYRPAADRIDAAIAQFYGARRRDFASSLAWHLASRFVATVDAALLLHLLGYPVGALEALFIQTISVLLNLVFAFIPLQIGAAEGGHYVLFQLLGMEPALGVVFSLVRRVRGLVWIAVGLLVVLVLSRRRTADAS